MDLGVGHRHRVGRSRDHLLIGVDVHSATFLEVIEPLPVVLYEMVKGRIKGVEPDIGKMHRI